MPHDDGGITETLNQELSAVDRKADAQKERAQERALIDKWADKIKFARNHDRKARHQWAEDRRMARGDTEFLVTTNLIGAIMEVLAAFLYAKNPDVSATPSESANRKMLEEFRELAKTLQIVISRQFRDAGLKKTAKRWVRGAMTVGISWIKCALQTRTERDPIMETQLNDLQDNLARIEALTQKQEEGESNDNESTLAEIRANIIAVEGQMERQVAEGLVLDLMAPEDVVVAPDCGEIENYLCAPWIAFDVYKDLDQAVAITKWSVKDLKQANLYTQRPRKGEDDEGSGSTNSTQWVTMANEEGEGAENPEGFYRFSEIWSLRDGVVFTVVDGFTKRWARPPFAPRTGKRFYPCFALAFHPVDGERYPQSDVFLLSDLQNEYNRTRSNYALHRFRSIPGVVFNAAAVKPESIEKLNSSEVAEYTAIDLVNPKDDMQRIFATKLYNRIDPGLYDTDQITTEMEKMSGAQDASQGGIQVEKTAFEAGILESGRSARTGARLDNLEDALTELAEYAAQLDLMTLDKADAQRYAGPEAVWMDLSTEDVLNLFYIEIKAGSTGKPKASSDREAWGTLMPLIEGMIDRVGQARLQGQEWAALPWINLLIETFNRLDDQTPVEDFLPVVPDEVVKANLNQELTDAERAEIGEDRAKALQSLAAAMEKVPLFAIPARAVVQDMQGQQPQQPQVPVTTEAVPAASPL